MNRLRDYYEANKKLLFASLISTFIWGLMAHAYCFFDSNFSHDSLLEFNAAIYSNSLKITSGRIFTGLYRAIFRGDLTLPWFTGVQSLIWIGLSVFLVLRLLDSRSRVLTFLTAGIMAANMTLSATAATYLHDLDSYMCALFCAVASVSLWRKGKWLWGAIPIALSLGIYQGYVFAAATLIILVSILDLLNNRSAKEVFHAGWKAIGMAAAGAVLYVICLLITLKITGQALHTTEANSVTNVLHIHPRNLLHLIPDTYRSWFSLLANKYMLIPHAGMKAVVSLLILACAGVLGIWLGRGKTGKWEKLLCLSLAALSPLCMNAIYILAEGNVHILMQYPVWLFYLFPLVLGDWLVKHWSGSTGSREKAAVLQRWTAAFLVGAVLYCSAQFANTIYLKKDLEHDAHVSFMTRVMSRVETIGGYVPGETELVFVGLPMSPPQLNTVAPGFENYTDIVGLLIPDVVFGDWTLRWQIYYYYMLGVPVNLAKETVWQEVAAREETKQMPSYPLDGSIAYQGDTLVVKFG